MIQLNVLSGKLAGSTSVARHFPFRVGRSLESDLVLPESGVWDQHLAIRFEPGDGFHVEVQGEALVTINGEAARDVRLGNGDTIEMGGVRLQFWIGETRQSGFRLREWLIWGGIAGVTLAQLILIYSLIT